MFSGKQGGPWDNDYRTLRFERDPSTLPASFGSKKMFGGFEPKPFTPISQRSNQRMRRSGKSVRLEPFVDFMKEGSLGAAEGKDNVQEWYLQAYLMVRFLLNPAGGMGASNRIRFEQFTSQLGKMNTAVSMNLQTDGDLKWLKMFASLIAAEKEQDELRDTILSSYRDDILRMDVNAYSREWEEVKSKWFLPR